MRARFSGFNASFPLVARGVSRNVRDRGALRVTAEVDTPVIKIGTRGRLVFILPYQVSTCHHSSRLRLSERHCSAQLKEYKFQKSRSPLALAQAYMTRDLLKASFPELGNDGALEICIIKVCQAALSLSTKPTFFSLYHLYRAYVPLMNL